VDDTAEIVRALRTRYPHINGPRAEDICYATSNRQAAVKAIAPSVEMLFVIGAPNVELHAAGRGRHAGGTPAVWSSAPARSIRHGWKASTRLA
jgi:hypothetical protein